MNSTSLIIIVCMASTLLNTKFVTGRITEEEYEEFAPILGDKLSEILPSYHNRFGGFLYQNDQESYLDVQEVSEGCREDMSEWILQLFSLKPSGWALQMIDAWGKFPEGILSGHFAVPGDFDECLKIRGNMSRAGDLLDFRGRYCYTSLTLTGVPIGFEFGTCYPSSCSKEEITFLQNRTLGPLGITPKQSGCYTDDPPKLSTGDVAMISVLAVLGVLCFIGTLTDLILNRENPKATAGKNLGVQSLVAFSVYTNTMKWLSTKSGGDNLGCIHGLRFFSTSWVVLCHTWQMNMSQPLWNLFDYINLFKDRWTMFPIVNGTVSVDTFFTMSGLLFSYNLLKMLNKTKGKFNVPMFYLHRFLRLTPTYALLVGIMATWFEHLGNGPKWHETQILGEVCRKYWWHNLLYINNVWDYGELKEDEPAVACHGETWYLAIDMQFFIVSPILIYPLWRWRKVGMGLMVLATLASVIVPFSVTYNLNLIPTLLPMVEMLDAADFYVKSYSKPWMRIGPYIIGLWAGYILFHFASQKKRLILPKYVVITGWLISTGTALAVIFGIMPWFDQGAEIPRLGSAFYAGFHRFAWGVSIAWIIIACTQGYGGFINNFLSWKVFMPLGRLTFCVYLISFQLQTLFHNRVRQAVSYDAYTSANLYFSHMVISLLVGFICCITMESPFIVLEKLIFEGGSKPSKQATPSPTGKHENNNNDA